MNETLLVLLLSALSIGFVHTLMGPDHYIPFIAMAKARKWSLTKTIVITTIGGICHVGSALLLGLIGVAVGLTVTKLNFITSAEVSLAAWFLIVFGLLYFSWGIRNVACKKEHAHEHWHPGHSHSDDKKSLKEITPWILFAILILGPCEALIPLIIYPAACGQSFSVILITILFTAATLFTMLFVVITAVWGVKQLKFPFLEQYGNAIAGLILFSTGCVIKVFGT